jgi:hypothetical protein
MLERRSSMPKIGIICAQPEPETAEEVLAEIEATLRRTSHINDLQFGYSFYDPAVVPLTNIDELYDGVRDSDLVIVFDARLSQGVPDNYVKDGVPIPIVATGGTRWLTGTHNDQVTGFRAPEGLLDRQMEAIFSRIGSGKVVMISVQGPEPYFTETLNSTVEAARRKGVALNIDDVVTVSSPNEIADAFQRAKDRGPSLIYLVPHAMLGAYPAHLASLETREFGVPVCYFSERSVEAGGFLSISTTERDWWGWNEEGRDDLARDGLGWYIRQILVERKPPASLERRERTLVERVNPEKEEAYRAEGRLPGEPV